MQKGLLIIFVLLLGGSFVSSKACADEEVGQRLYVKTSAEGDYYVKAIPKTSYGLEGQTKVYRVTEKDDILFSIEK